MTEEQIRQIIAEYGYDKYITDMYKKADKFHAEMAVLKKKQKPVDEDFLPAKSAWATFMYSFLNVIYHADHFPSLNAVDVNVAIEVSKTMRHAAFSLQESLINQYMIA